MALVPMVDQQNAEGLVKDLYGQIEKAFGYVPNALKIYSVSPRLLQHWWDSVRMYMEHPTIPYVPLLATVSLITAQDNKCSYCLNLNEVFLMEQGKVSRELISQTEADPDANSYLTPKDKALFLFAVKASRTPQAIAKQDIDALKNIGWSDTEIFDIVHYAARNVATDIVFNTFKIDRDA
jgi:uncharacterized peroxidase-related enzyme